MRDGAFEAVGGALNEGEVGTFHEAIGEHGVKHRAEATLSGAGLERVGGETTITHRREDRLDETFTHERLGGLASETTGVATASAGSEPSIGLEEVVDGRGSDRAHDSMISALSAP